MDSVLPIREKILRESKCLNLNLSGQQQTDLTACRLGMIDAMMQDDKKVIDEARTRHTNFFYLNFPQHPHAATEDFLHLYKTVRTHIDEIPEPKISSTRPTLSRAQQVQLAVARAQFS